MTPWRYIVISAVNRFADAVDFFVDAPRRRFDLKTLWPICKREAGDGEDGLDKAKAAFFIHVDNDSAWRRRYSHEQLIEIVGGLR